MYSGFIDRNHAYASLREVKQRQSLEAVLSYARCSHECLDRESQLLLDLCCFEIVMEQR